MDIDKDTKIIWKYMQMRMPLRKADAIFVLCSHDVRVAERAAEILKQGWSSRVIVSGGAGKLTKDMFTKPEAEVFKDVLLVNGVPEDKIIIEPNSTNTGENIRFVYELLHSKDIRFNSFILVQKPYMERRTFATFKKQWPDSSTEITIASPNVSYEQYVTDGEVDKDIVINVMVGDLQRIREYPKQGFQIEQDIPNGVWQAFERLTSAGYDKHLIRT